MSRSAVVALLAALLLAAPAAAACPRTSLADIEDEVMCPVCGTPLALAERPPQAERQRAFILERIERCEGKQEILDALVAEYGPAVLALPRPSGFDLVVYLVPIVAGVLATAIVVVLVLRRRRGRGEPDEPPPNVGADDAERLEAEEEASAEDEARLEADLRRYDL